MIKSTRINSVFLLEFIFICLCINSSQATPQSYSTPKYLIQTTGISYISNILNSPVAYSEGVQTLVYSNSSSFIIFLTKDSSGTYIQSSAWALPIGSLTLSKLMVSYDLTRIFIQTNDGFFTVSTYNAGTFIYNPSGHSYFGLVDISQNGQTFISSASNSSQDIPHNVLVYKDSGSGYLPLTQFNYVPFDNAASSMSYQSCVKFSKTSDSFLVFSFNSLGLIGSDYFNIYTFSLNSSSSYSYVQTLPGTPIYGIVQNYSSMKSNGSRLSWPSAVTDDDQIYGFAIGLNLNAVSFNSTQW